MHVTDFVDGDYGRGLYFSRYASTAVHFSTVSTKFVLAPAVANALQCYL